MPSVTVWDKFLHSVLSLSNHVHDAFVAPGSTPNYDGNSKGFNSSFVFVRNSQGQIVSVKVAEEEDVEVANLKKGIAEVSLLPRFASTATRLEIEGSSRFNPPTKALPNLTTPPRFFN